jgi:hypothetical protein
MGKYMSPMMLFVYAKSILRKSLADHGSSFIFKYGRKKSDKQKFQAGGLPMEIAVLLWTLL